MLAWATAAQKSHKRRPRVHLQVKNVVLRVQVDAHGLLLDGHDRQADVDAAVEFSLGQLETTHSLLASPHVSERENDGWAEQTRGNTYIGGTFCILQDAFLQHKVALSEEKKNKTWMTSIFIRTKLFIR